MVLDRIEMEEILKEIGYGVAVHYNEFSDEFEVYKIGTFYPGTQATEKSVLVKNKSLNIALQEYKESYINKP